MPLMGVLDLLPVITVCKCQFLTVGALTQPLWVLPRNKTPKLPCHMQPPTPLWNIDPLFIALARPVTLGSAQTFI